MKKLVIILTLMCATFSTTHPITSCNLVKGQPDIYVSDAAKKIGGTWYNDSVWDKNLIGTFYSLLPTNDFFVALDVGAQSGGFSLLAKYFPNSQWYSFEPIAEAAAALQENLDLNEVHNVTVCSKAVTSFSGHITLKMPTSMSLWGLATLGANVLRFDSIMEREVDCVDLDSFVFVNNIPKVHFIKIDTEGAELSILQGARKMIQRDHPIIVMEYNETNMKQCNSSKQSIDTFLQEMGYEWKLVSHEDILCTPITQ